jgi:putative heme-binding domain-containing protein
LNKSGGPESLAKALESAKVPQDTAKLALRQLYAIGRSDAALVTALSHAAGIASEIKAPTDAELKVLMDEVASKGDAKRGEEIFRREENSCFKCHALSGAGGQVGPELSDVGTVSPVDYLLNSVMVPELAVKELYQMMTVLTTDGRIVQGIIVDQDEQGVKLKDAALTAQFFDGKLAADLSKFKAFGGNWEGRMTVDAASAVPAVSFAMQGDSVAMSNLLGTLAGFDKLAGTGAFKIDATTRGDSFDALMRGLNGEVSTNLSEGALKGINVTQLVRSAQSLQQAFATGKLNTLDFRNVLSPTAETDFTKFDSVLKIENGVANVDLLKLISPALGIDGTGSIDIGGQKLDLRLATAIDKKGQGAGAVVQLNGIPVPVRLSGSWNQLKVTPDFSGVQAALEAELKGKLLDGITGGTGSSTSDIIGGITGGQPKTGTTPAVPATGETTPPAEAVPPRSTEEQLEDAAEKAARDALGGLFGRKRPATPEPEPEAEPEDATP